jgi:hypothetical protein
MENGKKEKGKIAKMQKGKRMKIVKNAFILV